MGDVPDSKGRLEILKVHAKNKRVNPEISLAEIAKRVPGFSGADLANLMNEAAILCGRRNKDSITALEIDDSIDRIVAGMEGPKLTDGKVKSLVAYHEVGHAICGTLTPGHDPVQKVTVVPRGQAKGLTWFTPGEDPTLSPSSRSSRASWGRSAGARPRSWSSGRTRGPRAPRGTCSRSATWRSRWSRTTGCPRSGPGPCRTRARRACARRRPCRATSSAPSWPSTR